MLRELAPDITPNLLKQIKTFIYKGQSPEMILFTLQQIQELDKSIFFEEWIALVNSLDELERKTLEYLSKQESPLEWEGRYTVGKRSEGRRKPWSKNKQLTKNYNILDGLMCLLNTQYNRDRINQEVVAALLGNSSVPALLRERLWEQHKKTPDDESEYLEDWDMRMAVAFNPQTSEAQRIEYLQQLLAYELSHIGCYMSEYIHRRIAKNPLTPLSILKFILQYRKGSIQDVIKNPNAPVSILRQAAQEDNSTTQGLVAEHPNTPKDLLQELSSTAIVLQNPNLTPLDIYKIKLELESRWETQEAEILIYKRTNNHNASLQSAFSQLNIQQSPTLQSLPRIYNPDTDDLPTLLAEYAQSNNPFVRFVTLLHPLTPQQTLTQAANSASWLERYAVAQNESTPLETRSILARDGNRIVRAAANHNL
ncbi:hypothetical protein Riv7116_5280 [Rivularia sp. PCC 7116]|uniref:hypothetical protein n=1 Tax=Rivularia sp. PCC 7116 TaxID=373994 RepID=UPI00029F370C|nr:hypothetical protein [Rivularia sp. PCC 7116]AFY57663.1 hypothetical protein Riv7116_5280 [Rivularia sp. PCC 7116]